MKNKQLISLLLLAAILTGAVSCGGGTPDDTTAPEEAAVTDAYDAMGLPNFGGETFTVLCRTGSRESEVHAEAENGEVVNDAVYARNNRIEEGLGIKLEHIAIDGGWSERAGFIDFITSSVMSGDDAFQMVLGYMHYMPALILENHFLDMNTLPHIDLTQPWWVDGFNTNATINGEMYMAMGDVCNSMLANAVSVFANRDLMEVYDYSAEEMYDDVRSGKWTYDKLTSLAKAAAADLNGDSVMDGNDRHGLGMNFMAIRAMTTAFGIDYTTRDADGLPQIALYSDRFVEAFEKNYENIHSDWFYTAENNYSERPDMLSKFKEGRTMFLAAYLGSTSQSLRDMEQSFAVVPMPKYDEAQKEYRTEAADPTSIIMVPITVKNTELCGAALEAINYESYQLVTPAYFETTLQAKYARDEDSQEMMEIIRDSLYFDFGYIFAGVIGGDINKLMDSSVVNSNIASIWESKSPTMKANLEKLLTFFRE